MRTWMVIPALALATTSCIVLFASLSGSSDAALAEHVSARVSDAAAAQNDPAMSDACVWSAEPAARNEGESCTETVSARAPRDGSGKSRALVWPDDFIDLTANAAVAAWDATVHFLTGLYDYAFKDEKEPVS